MLGVNGTPIDVSSTRSAGMGTIRPGKAMCLKGISGIALPKYFAPFFDNMLRQVPAQAVTVHPHLYMRSAYLLEVRENIYRLNQTHDHTPNGPGTVSASALVQLPTKCQSSRLPLYRWQHTAANAPSGADIVSIQAGPTGSRTHQSLQTSYRVIRQKISLDQSLL